MAVSLDSNDHLNEQQVLMLRLLKNPLPEKDFLQMRNLAVKLLSKKLDPTISKWEQDEHMVAKDYEKLSEGHFRTKS